MRGGPTRWEGGAGLAGLSGPEEARTCEELVELLREQHGELAVDITRLPRLHRSARQDAFLQLRRRLAVHEMLEQATLHPRVAGGFATAQADARLAEEARLSAGMESLEELDPHSVAFDAAYARWAVMLLRHARLEERLEFPRVTGPLDESARRRVAIACAMWRGEGEAYLGQTFGEMLRSAAEQLTP
jgi:hemerythrin HHE cation binding domain-containing protein